MRIILSQVKIALIKPIEIQIHYKVDVRHSNTLTNWLVSAFP